MMDSVIRDAAPHSDKHGQETIAFHMHPVSAGQQRDEWHPSLAGAAAAEIGHDGRSTPLEGPSGGPYGSGGGKHHGGGGGGSTRGGGGGGRHYHGGGYQHNLGGLQNAINKASRQKPTTPTTPTTPSTPTPSSGGNMFILFALVVAGAVGWYLWHKHHHKGEPLHEAR